LQLYPFQKDLKRDVYDDWEKGIGNVCMVLSTGGGKTCILSEIIKEHKGPSVVTAHRQELVCQISTNLAENGVTHRIIGPSNIVRLVVRIHMRKFGKSFYDPNSSCAVAGVDTLHRREEQLKKWADSVTLKITDECHHVQKNNKWGKAWEMFPNALGLGVTATPVRADGHGLGAHNDGVFQSLVIGPPMRFLIDQGYLSDYRIFAPSNDLDLSEVTVSKKTGEYSPVKLKSAIQKSQIVGDIVEHYLRIAPNKLGITFVESIETAELVAKKFNAAGVPACVVSSKTSDADRVSIIERFTRREILQLVNVDLFGEGFDLPAIEVMSMGRPTESYGWYVQAFGRPLRILEGKDFAIIIDHVGNVIRHGLPDTPKFWSLEPRDRRRRKVNDGSIPLKSCVNCASVYERIYKACPYCGHVDFPMARTAPEFVDGDLMELDPATLKKMREEIYNIELTSNDIRAKYGGRYLSDGVIKAQVKIHAERQESQRELRGIISWWAGHRKAEGRSLSESHRLFFHKYGIDVMSAQALKTKDSQLLTQQIKGDLPNG